MPTLIDKIWDEPVVAELGGGYQLLRIDRHLLHDLGGPMSLRRLQRSGQAVRNPELTFATADHCVATDPGRDENTTEISARLVPVLRERTAIEGITYFDIDSPRQGIVHVVAPELGITLPGTTLVCGDSHTCTNGALGALSFGIGTSESVHVLATQCLIERKPRHLRVMFYGEMGRGVAAKDLALHLIATEGADLGVGHAIEYAGETISRLPMHARMTLCNLSIELGSKIGIIAPDELTYAFLKGTPYAPQGRAWDTALAHWRGLRTDDDAVFDREVSIDVTEIELQVSWGTSPEETIAVGGRVPDPLDAPNDLVAASWRESMDYMGLSARQSLEGLPVDRVFIGSCTNSRLADLIEAAAIAEKGHVADGVVAWVVPGSKQVKRQAEAMGLAERFTKSGFEWREPGCSQCVATNGEYVDPGERCVSTSNRNFVGRQGPGARTHLASPAMTAYAAIKGEIADVREVM